MKKIQKEEGLKLYGRWRLTARYKGTDKVAKVIEGENLIVTVGKEYIGDILIGDEAADTELTYCAIGTDNTAPLIGDTTLGSEGAGAPSAMRKTITAGTRVVNEITLSTFFTAAQSNIIVEEAGIFGGDADGTVDSGVLFSHWLVSFDNSGADYDLTFDYVLTIG